MTAPALHGYYAIVDVRGPDLDLERELSRGEELLAARPCCLQLRAKQLGGRDLLALARALVAACRRAGVASCVNDRLDVALIAGADMVHVGQEDLPLVDVRRVLDDVLGEAPAGGRRLLVGVSTHSLAQARAAAEGGADYIGFGPLFATSSKLRPDPVVGIAGLREVVAAIPLPVVAIGGITRRQLAQVVATGAAAAAVIADIDNATHRLTAAREVAEAFGSTLHA
jgi:thiamine-phosphate pyrophosphorylase